MHGLSGKKDFRGNLRLNGYRKVREMFFGIFLALVNVVLLVVHVLLFFKEDVEKGFCVRGLFFGLIGLVSSVGIIIDHLPPQF